MRERHGDEGIGGSRVDEQHTYGYDNAGQLTSATPSTGTATSWTYDNVGRRSTEVSGATTKTYRYDDANQLCWTVTGTSSNTCSSAPSGATTYTYDQAGRRLTETVTSTDKVTYTYDPAGRINTLARVSDANTTTQTRTYDAQDNLITANNAGANTTASTFDWDLTQPIPQLADQVIGGTTTNLAYGAGHWASQSVGGVVAAVGLDVHESAIPTNNTTGLAQSSSYTAWGEPTGSSTTEPRLGYRGEVSADTLLNLRARQYHPDSGTFVGVDPLDGVDGTTTVGHRYSYADNSPIMRVDPLGLQSTDAQFAGEGALYTASASCPPGRHLITTPPPGYPGATPGTQCVLGDRATNLLGRKASIYKFAYLNGISVHLLAATLWHEGGNYLGNNRLAAQLFDECVQIYPCPATVGIGNINPSTAQFVLGHVGISIPLFEMRWRLIYNDDFSIGVAAGFLNLLRRSYPGVSDRGIFTLYAAAPQDAVSSRRLAVQLR